MLLCRVNQQGGIDKARRARIHHRRWNEQSGTLDLIWLRRGSRGFVSIAILVLVLIGKGELSTNASAAEPPIAGAHPQETTTLLSTQLFVLDAGDTLSLTLASFEEAPNRADCRSITGTDYLSIEERHWYLANCTKQSSTVLVSQPVPAPANRGGVIDEFVAGYRSAGGLEAYLDRIVNRVIPCESSGIPTARSRQGYLGLMQFAPSTWASVGGGDWTSPWQQGANTARLLQRSNPASQWPTCWFR